MGEYEKRDQENCRKELNRTSRNKNGVTKIKKKSQWIGWTIN